MHSTSAIYVSVIVFPLVPWRICLKNMCKTKEESPEGTSSDDEDVKARCKNQMHLGKYQKQLLQVEWL